MAEKFLFFLESTFNTTNPTGLLALGLLAAITDIGIPVPFVLDTILLLAAYNVLSSHSHEWTPVILIVIMLFVGRQLGSGVLYLISRTLGTRFVEWLKRRLPSIGSRLDSFRSRFTGWAPVAVVTGRLTPGLLQITSVAAGTICLPYTHFALGVAVSSIVYDSILILLGFIAAHYPGSGNINFTVLLLIALVVVVSLLWPTVFIMLRRSSRKSPPNSK